MRARELTLYLHDASKERLITLATVLGISRTAVVAQAISRWALRVVSSKDLKWEWHIEKAPPVKRRGRTGQNGSGTRPTFRMYARVPDGVREQVEWLSDTFRVPLSAIVEQALLRWYREDPFVDQVLKDKGANDASHAGV